MEKLTPIKETPNKIAAGVRIGHVHLKAANLDLIKNFYVDILGFEIINDLGSALFLSAGGYHHHLAFNTWHSKGAAQPPINSTGLYHVALLYPTRRELADALKRLVDASWPIEGASDHGTHEAIYLSDSEGNGLELAWDRPQNEWPVDDEGHLIGEMKRLDLQNLLAELN